MTSSRKKLSDSRESAMSNLNHRSAISTHHQGNGNFALSPRGHQSGPNEYSYHVEGLPAHGWVQQQHGSHMRMRKESGKW
ncbi:hypothetical protein Hamer_G015427, partial [Homarus americanus]